MEITIQIGLVPTLERLALGANITPEKYIENFMEAHLFSQYKKELVDIINEQTVENLMIMKSIANPAIAAVETKIAEEKAQAEVEAATLVTEAEKLMSGETVEVPVEVKPQSVVETPVEEVVTEPAVKEPVVETPIVETPETTTIPPIVPEPPVNG